MIRKDDGKGVVLRVLSLNLGVVVFLGIWEGYYDGYVNEVWKKY